MVPPTEICEVTAGGLWVEEKINKLMKSYKYKM